jgi:hypothetical protein
MQQHAAVRLLDAQRVTVDVVRLRFQSSLLRNLMSSSGM